MTSLLLTFDYELFLGSRNLSSGTVEKCLIEPTNAILQVLKKYGITNSIFFVDATYLLLLKKTSLKNQDARRDFTKICEQLKSLIKEKHYIFLHLHPHWVDAVYLPVINQWNLLNQEKYRIHDINPESRNELFNQSLKLLNDIIQGAGADFKVEGFRAGGYCIQPFKELKSLFEHHGILFDFSVLKGEKLSTYPHRFNFVNAPPEEYYRFSTNVLKSESTGPYWEFPITKYTVGIYDYLYTKYLVKHRGGNEEMWGLSETTQLACSINGSKVHGELEITTLTFTKKIRKYVSLFLRQEVDTMSIENMNFKNLKSYIQTIKNRKYSQFITHPKGITTQNLEIFDLFLKEIHTIQDLTYDFKNLI